MNTELVQQFWTAMQQSVFITEAAEQVGTYREICLVIPGCGSSHNAP